MEAQWWVLPLVDKLERPWERFVAAPHQHVLHESQPDGPEQVVRSSLRGWFPFLQKVRARLEYWLLQPSAGLHHHQPRHTALVRQRLEDEERRLMLRPQCYVAVKWP